MSPIDRAAAMSWPAICRHCHYLHDAGKAETVQRYADCSVWRCPACKVLIDDRPPSRGGCVTGHEDVSRSLAPNTSRTTR